MTGIVWRLRAWALAAGLAAFLVTAVGAEEKKDAPKKEETKKAEPKRQPSTKTDAPDDYKLSLGGWAKRHESFLARAKQGGVDVLFLGDSITQGWEGAGKEVWKETWAPLNAANFGISGDRTQDVLWRITGGKELEGIDPKVAVLMIGTNNVGANTADEIAAGVTAIVRSLREQKPNMKVLLLGVFPRSGKNAKALKDPDRVAPDELHAKIKEINTRIAKLADDHVTYLDIGGKFLDADGGLPKTIMPDFLHLSPKGYQIWADATQAVVTRLLK